MTHHAYTTWHGGRLDDPPCIHHVPRGMEAGSMTHHAHTTWHGGGITRHVAVGRMTGSESG